MIEMILSFWSFIRDTFLLKPWFTPLTLVIGGAWALLQFRTANKHERNNNELLNQPKFSFFDSMNCHSEIKRSCDTNEEVCRPMPDYCDNPECNKLHLFDIKNEGNFSADQITVSVALEGESDFLSKIKERRMGAKHLQTKESLQFSIPANTLSIKNYNTKPNGGNFRFYIFIQYRSSYSKYWYRRIYQLDASKIIPVSLSTERNKKNILNSPWARGVEFYAISEQDCKCQKDVKLLEQLRICTHTKSKQNLEQYASLWVSNFFELGILCKMYTYFLNAIKNGETRKRKHG
jgi:hypothetical protein